MLRVALNLAGRILDGVSDSFSPSPVATSKEVRINGAIAVGMGFLCFAVAGAVLFLARSEWGLRLAFVPAVAAYAFWIVGGYRLVFGVSAKADPYEVASLHRILFGVGWVVLLIGGPILVLIWLGS
ncbi:MAG TPA: hypothetical protein VK138_13205 [Acidiferrobacterales bacterium]|nr:hypothetical protein [Acidiferrobacterales bacterium]